MKKRSPKLKPGAALKQQEVDFTAEGAPPPGFVGVNVPNQGAAEAEPPLKERSGQRDQPPGVTGLAGDTSD